MVSFLSGIACLVAACIWGFAFVVVKDSLNYVNPVLMIALRFSLAAIIFSFSFIKNRKVISSKYFIKASIVGVFLFLGYLTQTIGCNFTTPGKNAFYTTIYVVLIPFIGWAVSKSKPKWFVFLAVFLQMAGIGFLSLKNDVSSGFSFNKGDFLTLLCGVFFAIQIFLQSFFTSKGDENEPLLYSEIEFIVAAFLGWIFLPFYNGETSSLTMHIQNIDFESLQNSRVLFSFLYLGIASTGIAFLLQNIGLKNLKSSFATILLSFESVFGMLFSVLIPINGVRETLSFCGIAGCILIFTAIIFAQKG